MKTVDEYLKEFMELPVEKVTKKHIEVFEKGFKITNKKMSKKNGQRLLDILKYQIGSN